VSGKADRWRWLKELFSPVNHFWTTDQLTMLVAALVVGTGTGVAILIFHAVLRWVREASAWLVAYLGSGAIHLIAVAALGGLVVGLIARYFAPELEGSGIPHTLLSLSMRGGYLPFRIVIWRPIATAITLGAGGSAGREGPIAHYGAALGSALGRWLNLSDERVRALVACGAAAGISASFNAPIAGVFFALEVLLQDLTASYFAMAVLAAVAGGAVSQAVTPVQAMFQVPAYTLGTPWELPFYLLMGVIIAVVAVLFIRTLFGYDQFLRRHRVPLAVKTTLGMALTGLIGIAAPEVLGSGFQVVGTDLRQNLPTGRALELLPAKFAATVFTIGGRLSGGIFAPSLFMGAMLGTAYGEIVHRFFPTITDPAGAYAIVGMAAMFAAVSHAPLTAMLIVFELTNDYALILPLMLATVVSTFLSEWLNHDSIYTLRLARQGIHVSEEATEIELLQSLRVSEAMCCEPETVGPDTTLRELSRLFVREQTDSFPVVDAEGTLLGVVAIRDVARAIARGADENTTTARQVMARNIVIAFPDDPLWIAKRRMRAKGRSEIIVVDPETRQKLLGVVRPDDIARAYNQALLRQVQLEHRIEEMQLHHFNQTVSGKVTLGADSPLVGKRLEEVRWPVECLITTIRRGRRMIIPRGHHRLRVGDQLTFLVGAEDLQTFLDFVHPAGAPVIGATDFLIELSQADLEKEVPGV
jgi:CIC family chloride channel protein